MREYKFRSIAINEEFKGEWIIGTAVQRFEYPEEIENRKGYKFEYFIFNIDYGWVKVNGETIGEFTGLIDINVKEIYENDLLKDEEGFLWKVFYNNGAFYAECAELMAVQLLSTVNLYCVVEGNVYEHPDLLEQKVKG